MQSVMSLEALLKKIVDAFYCDTKIETVLPAYMELLSEMLDSEELIMPAPNSVYSQQPQPQLPPGHQLRIPVEERRDPTSPNYLNDPMNPNSKHQRGKLRPFKEKGNSDVLSESVDQSGGGFET